MNELPPFSRRLHPVLLGGRNVVDSAIVGAWVATLLVDSAHILARTHVMVRSGTVVFEADGILCESLRPGGNKSRKTDSRRVAEERKASQTRIRTHLPAIDEDRFVARLALCDPDVAEKP